MDCWEGLSLIPNKSIDKVLTSPPYNIIRPNSTDRGYDIYKDGMTNEEYSEWILSLFEQFDRVLVDNGCVMWNMSYGCENTECMSLTIADIIRKSNFTIADIIVWKKQSATPNN
jgi:DNA modification methylase